MTCSDGAVAFHVGYLPASPLRCNTSEGEKKKHNPDKKKKMNV